MQPQPLLQPQPQAPLRNKYADIPGGYLGSLIQEALPTGVQPRQFQQVQQPAPQTGFGGGFGTASGTGSFGFGAPKPATGGFGFGVNTGAAAAAAPVVLGIRSDEHLRMLQESLAQASNLRAGALQMQWGAPRQTSLTKEEYFGMQGGERGFAQNYAQQETAYQQPGLSVYASMHSFGAQPGQMGVSGGMGAQGMQRQALNLSGTAPDSPAKMLRQSLKDSVFYSAVSSQISLQKTGPALAASRFTDPSLGQQKLQLGVVQRSQFLEYDQPQQVPQMPGQSDLNPINPNAPKLTRTDYFCTPPIDRLRRMSDDDLSRISGFCIRRISGGQVIGQILFKGIVDLRQIDLDAAIQIDIASCQVLLNSPTSFNLNVPAVISLFKIESLDPNYARKIEQATTELGGRLISYDQQRGEWIFEVDGFL